MLGFTKNSFHEAYLAETLKVLRQYKELADKGLNQLESDKEFFHEFGPRSHSIAVTIKHVSGNLKSRWFDFLTTDGEKPDRDRDNEFKILPEDTRAALMSKWEEGWGILLDSLSKLRPKDLERTVKIRSEPHSVSLAIQRSVAHTTYHIGQILYLCRLVKTGEWQWLTVPPGTSAALNQEMRARHTR